MNKLALLVLMALTACASQEQLKQAQAAKAQQADEVLGQIEATCTAAGITPATKAYATCLQDQAGKHGYVIAASADGPTLQPANGPRTSVFPYGQSDTPVTGPVVLATGAAMSGGGGHR